MFCENIPRRYECMKVEDLTDETLSSVCRFVGAKEEWVWSKMEGGVCAVVAGIFNEITRGCWVVKWAYPSQNIFGTAHSEKDFFSKFRVMNG